MKKTIYAAAFVVTAAFLLNGCAKDGAVGPQGPQGPTGNANVQAANYQVTSWSSTAFGGDTINYWYAQFGVPELTGAAQNAGAVELFFSSDGGTTWQAVPFTLPNNPSADYIMSFLTQTNFIEVDWTYDGGSLGQSPNTVFNTTALFKVVVIPPALKKPSVNTRNYAALKAAYNLRD